MIQRTYVDLAKAVLAEHFRSNDPDGSMTAASAAYILKRLAGSFEEAGFFKFKDLLGLLESEGFLKTGTNSKNAFSFHLASTPVSHGVPAFRSQRRLRADVWYAFVKSEPEGQRFFNVETGHIRTQCESSPGVEWVEISPIDPANEKQLALEFLTQKHLSVEDAKPALDATNWYIAFPEFLKQHSVQLASDWKRDRSVAVVAIVEEWRQQHNIDEELVYETRQSQLIRTSSLSRSTAQSNRGREPLRQALLNAIGRMSAEELLEVRIPTSYLVDELRPDLLK